MTKHFPCKPIITSEPLHLQAMHGSYRYAIFLRLLTCVSSCIFGCYLATMSRMQTNCGISGNVHHNNFKNPIIIGDNAYTVTCIHNFACEQKCIYQSMHKLIVRTCTLHKESPKLTHIKHEWQHITTHSLILSHLLPPSLPPSHTGICVSGAPHAPPPLLPSDIHKPPGPSNRGKGTQKPSPSIKSSAMRMPQRFR